MRRTFFKALHEQMDKNKDVYFLTGDLGYGLADNLFAGFPDRSINCGASEQTMLDIGVGLALSGKVVFCYTITPFFLRGYETIRTYIDHECLKVHLVGSGRDKDYAHDGFSHDGSDIGDCLRPFNNIEQHYPDTKEEITQLVESTISSNYPRFISLKR